MDSCWFHRQGNVPSGISKHSSFRRLLNSCVQRKPGNLDISKRVSDFPETYTAIGCRGAMMEMEIYDS